MINEVHISLKEDNTNLGNLFRFLIEKLNTNRCDSNYSYNEESFIHYANFWNYEDLDKFSFKNMIYSCMINKKNRKVEIQYSKMKNHII